jgi:hypothetical protein
VPVLSAAAGAAHRPAVADAELREALLARVRSASARAYQDAELDAEIAALEAVGVCAVPSVAELEGLAPDPYAGPPQGEWAWLNDLPEPLLEEYLQATAEPPGPEVLAAGLTGTMDQLRAQVFLTLLTGQPVACLLPQGGPASGEPCAPAGLPGSPGGPPLAGTITPVYRPARW